MQSKLRSLFAGKREAVELPAKRGPGRPPKLRKREEAAEMPDEWVEALQSVPDQPEAYDEHLSVRRRKRMPSVALEEAAGKPVAHLRMPGSSERDSKHEGPQVRLRLCNWFEKTLEDLGGSDESRGALLTAVAERWGVTWGEVSKILRNKAKWQEQCEARGVTDSALKMDEAHLPRYLRTSKR